MFISLDPATGVYAKPVLYGVSFEHFDSANGVSRSGLILIRKTAFLLIIPSGDGRHVRSGQGRP